MLEVTTAEYLDGYRIRVAFNNGAQGVVELSDALWGPMFEPLKNIHDFQKFTVSPTLHTLHWESNADLAPEYLYEKMIEQANAPAVGPVSKSTSLPPAR